MTYYVRKISRAKWPNNEHESDFDYDNFDINELKADAITGCIKTSSNELSLWKIESKDEDINAILPIVAGFEKPNTFDIVYIQEEDLKEAGIELNKTKGRTPVIELQELHYDADVKNYSGLGTFAKIITHALKDNYKRIKEKDVKKIIEKAIADGKLNKEDLDLKMQEKLGYISMSVSIKQL